VCLTQHSIGYAQLCSTFRVSCEGILQDGCNFHPAFNPWFSSPLGDETIILILRHFWPLLERILSSDHMQNVCLSTAVCKALSQAIQASGRNFSALLDRFCVHFQVNATLSENNLVACCGFRCGSGCNGDFPLSAWRYFSRRGVVIDECYPYFDNDGCNHPGCEPSYPTRRCVKHYKDNPN